VSVVLAPSRLAGAVRSLLLVVAMLLVGAVMLAANGPPQSSRDAHRDEIKRYAPRLFQGAAQLGGESLLVVGLAWACGGALKIRL
jgi:hypothetical protein